MTGGRGSSTLCAFCGGRATEGAATVPFVFEKTIVVMRDVPAFVCEECGEPFVSGRIADAVTEVLTRLRSLGIEVSVISYSDIADSAVVEAS